ncbi:uncharacterized protein LOC108103823 [Drosophila eugracilis]|uniref:uncharacterized protein LOC108103823 n=1 Tax=Drosophila eugracilis TaxID=29029 RepID=UPI0007E803E6|nr:uncharacterized protein LOC108103823 [Drosophila eugracilis]
MPYYLEHAFTGAKYYMLKGINTLGRHSMCTCPLYYDYISRYHASITVTNERIYVKALDALNGLYLNFMEERLQDYLEEIFIGDVLIFGCQIRVNEMSQSPHTFGVFMVNFQELEPMDSSDQNDPSEPSKTSESSDSSDSSDSSKPSKPSKSSEPSKSSDQDESYDSDVMEEVPPLPAPEW